MDPSHKRALEILESSIMNEGSKDETTKELSSSSDGGSDATKVKSATGKDDAVGEQSDVTCCAKYPVPLIVTLCCTAIAVIIMCLFLFGIMDNSDLEGIPLIEDIDFDGFFDSDPFGGEITPFTPPEEAYKWSSLGTHGLKLNLLNSLDESWQQFYNKAVFQWENGSPNALTLTSERVPHDPSCEQQNYVMKVCNGDYGETDWRGLNIVLFDVQTHFIYSSSAKMNDFYLEAASNDQRQYTMCHELGHGFGLPHWDEDFTNRNIGNCMDYTNEPQSNAQPDRSNFEFLAGLYGAVEGSGNGSKEQSGNGDDTTEEEIPTNVGWGRGNDRKLRGSVHQPKKQVHLPASRRMEAPRELLDRLNEASRSLDSFPGGPVEPDSSWKLVNSGQDGEIRELELEGGYAARAYILRAEKV